MDKPKYTLTQDSITVIHEGRPFTVTKGQSNFESLKSAIESERWDDVPNYLTVKSTVKAWAKGKFTLAEDGKHFLYEGKIIPHELNDKINSLVSANADPEAFFRFYERLMRNPSWRSVSQLFPFLNQKGIPLTKDGCFLAYKSVKADYRDHHSGMFVNSPGSVHQMPRNQISDDPNHACHEGFHVGALSYARSFGAGNSRLVICKVAPEDVVCVPYDSSQQKMRVCKYRVVGEHGTDLPDSVLSDDMLPDVEEHEGVKLEEGDDNIKHKAAKKAVSKKRGAIPKKYQPIHESKSMTDYKKFTVPELREYAIKVLKIVGVHRLPGGKAGLIAKILTVREGFTPHE